MYVLVSLRSLEIFFCFVVHFYQYTTSSPTVEISLTKIIPFKALAIEQILPSKNCTHLTGIQFSILCQDYLTPKLPRGSVSLWFFHPCPPNFPSLCIPCMFKEMSSTPYSLELRNQPQKLNLASS